MRRNGTGHPSTRCDRPCTQKCVLEQKQAYYRTEGNSALNYGLYLMQHEAQTDHWGAHAVSPQVEVNMTDVFKAGRVIRYIREYMAKNNPNNQKFTNVAGKAERRRQFEQSKRTTSNTTRTPRRTCQLPYLPVVEGSGKRM